MTNKLEMPLEQFAEAVAKENNRLLSGPGGIMEMKQTISDKEAAYDMLFDEYIKLKSQHLSRVDNIQILEGRVSFLETTLREIVDQIRQYEIPASIITLLILQKAEKALGNDRSV